MIVTSHRMSSKQSLTTIICLYKTAAKFSVTLHNYSCFCTLNKLDASTNGNYAIYRNPQTLSSALATFRMLQPRALRFLNRIIPLVSVSNYYVRQIMIIHQYCNPTKLTLQQGLKYIAEVTQSTHQASILLNNTCCRAVLSLQHIAVPVFPTPCNTFV